MDMQLALAKIVSEATMVGKDRIDKGETEDFTDLRDAMISVHCAFQAFVKMVREKREIGAVSTTGLQMAAVITKLVVDLSKSNHVIKSTESKKSTLLEELLKKDMEEEIGGEEVELEENEID